MRRSAGHDREVGHGVRQSDARESDEPVVVAVGRRSACWWFASTLFFHLVKNMFLVCSSVGVKGNLSLKQMEVFYQLAEGANSQTPPK